MANLTHEIVIESPFARNQVISNKTDEQSLANVTSPTLIGVPIECRLRNQSGYCLGGVAL